MKNLKIQQRLQWLSDTLSIQRNQINKMLWRLRGIAVSAGTSFVLHRKFLKMMRQVAYDQEKELDIINEIEAIEKRHQEMKRRKMLRAADPKLTQGKDPLFDLENQPGEQRKPRRFGMLKMFGLLYLFAGKPVQPRRQEPAPE